MDTPVADWILCQTLTTGTGAVTLGNALTGYTDFRGGLQSSGTVWYSLLTQTGDRECGIGTFDYTANTLTRSTIHATLAGGVYDNTSPGPISLVGTTIVACTFNSESWKEFITDVSIGTTTTGAAGTSASVTNTGTHSHPVFNFTIPQGATGPTGATGSAATVSVGSTTTGAAGSSAAVSNSGTSSAAVLNFTIPTGAQGPTGATGATGSPGADGKTTLSGSGAPSSGLGNNGDFYIDTAAHTIYGPKTAGSWGSSTSLVGPTGPTGPTGATGSAATVAVGTTSTGSAGSSASVTNSGTSSAAVLNFTIPQGANGSPGTAATVSIGTTSTGAAGSSASVSNSGTSSAAVFNFTIPKGDTGATGPTGAAGPNTVTTSTSTTLTGLLKGNGSTVSQATSGTDYAPPTSGNSLLSGNGSGGFSNVTIGSGLSFAGGSLSATTASVNISNDTATATALYPAFLNATTGTAATLYTGNSRLLYTPATGQLQSTTLRAGNGIVVNSATISENQTIAAGDNATSAGPMAVASGVTVTVSSGSVWVVV